MDPVKLILLSLVAAIFAVLLWIALVFPRLWLLGYLRLKGERPPRRELLKRLWQIEPDEMKRLADTLDDEEKEQIMQRCRIDQLYLVIVAIVIFFAAGGLTFVGWLVSQFR